MKTRNIYFTILIACAVFAVSCQVPEKKKQSHRLNVPNVADIAEGKYANKGLKSVTFGKETVSIGKDAFKGNKITKLTLPSSLTTIEAGAFENNAIKTLELPSNVEHIGENAFKGNALKEVTLNSKKVKHLNAEMFKNKDGTLPTFLLPNKEVMEHVMSMFVTTNADGTKTIDVTFKTKDKASLSQKAINDYKKTLTEKKKPSEAPKADAEERTDTSGLCTLRFMDGDTEHHKAETTCGTGIADKDRPSIPTKTHYTFYIWSDTQVVLDDARVIGGTHHRYLNRYPVTKKEQKLYAYWKPNVYKAQFMRDDATEHTAVDVAYKEKVDKADVGTPTYKHYTFENWYKDKAFTQPFRFDADTIEGPTTLYAKRTPKQYEVEFSGHFAGNTLNVAYGSPITSADAPKPTWGGVGDNTFENWYKDKAFTQPFRFDEDIITGPTTLYGKWQNRFHSVFTYAIYEWNFYFDKDEEYSFYASSGYLKDSFSRNLVTDGFRFPRPTKPEDLDLDSSVTWPTKWFRIQHTDRSKANFSTQEAKWIKTWVKGKNRFKSKLNTLFIERFEFKDGKNTITENTFLLGLMRVNYKAEFFVHGKSIGSSQMDYGKKNKIKDLLEKGKIKLPIPEGFDESNSHFDGWYTKRDYEKVKDGYKKYFYKKNKYTLTLDGKYDAEMYGRWIKTYEVQYKYKEKTIKKEFKDEKELIMHINGIKTHVMEPVYARPDDEIKRELGYEKDEPKKEAPDGYTLYFCWYSDEDLHDVYHFPALEKPTTKIYGAWKFAKYDGRIGKIDCGVTKDPTEP